MIPRDAILTAARRVEAAYPLEGCGVILESAGAFEVRELRNVARDPRRAFELDPSQLLQALSGPRTLAAIFHSHPDGDTDLSAADRLGAFVEGRPSFPDVLHLVLAVRAGTAVAYAVHGWSEGNWRVVDRSSVTKP